MFLLLWALPRTIAIGAIGIYQATLSPDHGPLRHMHPYGYCRHEPTCSMYAKNVMRERGFLLGMLLTGKRVLSCTPWAKPDDKKIRAVLLR